LLIHQVADQTWEGAIRRLAQTPVLWGLRFPEGTSRSGLAQTLAFWRQRSPEGTLFRQGIVEGILSSTMPFYKRTYSPGELQFITTSTYRRAPLFLSERFSRCFVQTLEEVR